MSEKTDIKNVIKLLASIMGYLGYYGIDDPPPPPIIQKIFLYKNNLLKRGQVYRYYCTINT